MMNPFLKYIRRVRPGLFKMKSKKWNDFHAYWFDLYPWMQQAIASTSQWDLVQVTLKKTNEV